MMEEFAVTIRTSRESIRITPDATWRFQDDLYQVREDDTCTLSLEAPARLGPPQLSMQGVMAEGPSQVTDEGSQRVWHWREGRHFHNCFGWTVLRAEWESDLLVEFPPVDVVARKVQADEATAMLDFLGSQDTRLLHACFVQARAGDDWGIGSPAVERVLKSADEVLSGVEQLVFSTFRRACSRLVEQHVLKAPDVSDSLDDRSLQYLLAHPDSMTLTPAPHLLPVAVAGRSLYLREVQAVRKVESTDVYENGVVQGLLLSVRGRLLAVQRHLAQIQVFSERQAVSRPIPEGYAPFQAVGSHYLEKAAKYPLARVQGLLLRLDRAQKRAQSVIAARPVRQAPRLTPYFSANPRYRAIYRAAHSWYSLAEGLAAPAQALLGLQSLDRLYEYVALFGLLTAFRQEDWELVEAQRLGPPGDSAIEVIADLHQLRHDRIGSLELRYEPRIEPEGQPGEAWDLVKVAGGAGPGYPYRPDFVLRFTDLAGNDRTSAVFDAKYADFATIRERHLPDLTLKYLHGIRRAGAPERPPFDHLWVLGPVRREPFAFHRLRRGAAPVRPTLGILNVHPSDPTTAIRWWYRNVLLPDLL
ncbi:MAG: hypothetical protein M1602_06615 [Firmicutes bacterium]|nr:hypothetical protein [Bacillota bacterium]